MLRLAWRTCGEAAEMGAKSIACCGVARSDKSLASLSWRASGGTKRAGGARAEAWCAGGEGGKEPGDVADEVRASGRHLALGS